MDVKWLLGRAGESVVAVGCCVKWAGLIMQISRVGGVYCVRIPILLERLCSDPHFTVGRFRLPVWNSLPRELRDPACGFKQFLKTILFSLC